MDVLRTPAQAAGRLRWRLRGAWLWPTFAALTVADAVLITRQPLSGTDTGLVPAFLLAGFANLLAVALLAGAAGALLRRRDPSLPRVVARDRGGTVVLVGVSVVFVALGIAHRGAAQSERDAFRAQSDAVRLYVAHNAPAAYRRHIDEADTWQPGPDFYRTCVPGDDPARPLCLLVNTDQSPPGIRVDPSRETNAVLAGADNPGRQRG